VRSTNSEQVASPGSIGTLLCELDLAGEQTSVLLVGPEAYAAELSDVGEVVVAGRVASARELADDLRSDLAIVIDQVEEMSREEAEHLLCRLRDILCGRVLLVVRGRRWSRAELLALGFLELKQTAGDRRLYLFDPALFNEPRDWNNPASWANPENFDRYRW
jgi:Family of unknown function (DUF6231)